MIVDINSDTIFLKRTEEKELIDLLNNFKSEKSTDCTDTDMTLIKNVKKYI